MKSKMFSKVGSLVVLLLIFSVSAVLYSCAEKDSAAGNTMTEVSSDADMSAGANEKGAGVVFGTKHEAERYLRFDPNNPDDLANFEKNHGMSYADFLKTHPDAPKPDNMDNM